MDRTGADLVVLSPALGALTETFIERHCRDLAPGATAFVTFEADARASDAGLTLQLPSPEAPHPSLFARARSRVVPPDRRHAQRSTWGLEGRSVDAVVRHVQQTGARVVLAEYLDRWLDVVEPLRAAGVRVVVHGHGYDLSASLLNRRTLHAYRSRLPVAEAVVVPSRHARDQLLGAGVDANVVVVPYGVEVPDVAPARTATSGPVRCLAVGRLVPKKDPVGLVEAIVRARRAGSRVELDLVGDGPLAGAVAAVVEREGAGDVVRLHGAQPHERVIELLGTSALFVQHSVVATGGDSEGLPLAILEAMAAGLPVVSTTHAGIPEAVQDGATGRLVAPGDLDAFAGAVSDYAADPERRASHGLAGWRRARERFTWERNRDELRSVLELDG